jgi:type VI protein secretion system component Hcp
MGNSMSIDGLVSNQTISIDIQSFVFGSGANTTAPLGIGTGTGRAQTNEFTVMKNVDKYSPLLFQKYTQGSQFQVTISAKGLAFKFSDAVIAGIHAGGSGDGDGISETITFGFTSISTKADSAAPSDADGGTCDSDDDDDWS